MKELLQFVLPSDSLLQQKLFARDRILSLYPIVSQLVQYSSVAPGLILGSQDAFYAKPRCVWVLGV